MDRQSIAVPRDMAEASPGDGLDTFAKLLADHAQRRGDRTAIREKDFGIWQSWTWAQALDEVQLLACGLAALGFRRGDKLAVIGDNRPRLYWGMVAAQALGGVPVPIYQDSVAEETAYVVDHADVRFALAEDQEQVDKLLQIMPDCPKLETIIYDNDRGMRSYTQPFLHSYDQLQDAGRAFEADNPGFYEAEMIAPESSPEPTSRPRRPARHRR